MKRVIHIVLIVLCLLLIPLIAMQFTNQMNWDTFDFLVMGALLFITGLALDYGLRRWSKHKVLVAGGIILIFVYIWAELAVGIFTNLGN